LVGDIAKASGTATIGSFALDSHAERTNGGEAVASAVYSVPITGAGTITITFAATHYYWCGVAEFSGTALSGVDGQNTGNGITGLPATGSVTSAGAAVFVGALATYTAGALTHTPGADYEQIYEQENGALHMTGSSEDRIVGGSTSDTADWLAPNMSAAWCAALAVYRTGAVPDQSGRMAVQQRMG
jgi:hypothetical protein